MTALPDTPPIVARAALQDMRVRVAADLGHLLSGTSTPTMPTLSGVRSRAASKARGLIHRAMGAFETSGDVAVREYIALAILALREPEKPSPSLEDRRDGLCERLEALAEALHEKERAVEDAAAAERRAEAERFPRDKERADRLSGYAYCVAVACDLLDKLAPGVLERRGEPPERIIPSILVLLLRDMRTDVYSAGGPRAGEFNLRVARAEKPLMDGDYRQAWARLEEAAELLPLEPGEPPG